MEYFDFQLPNCLEIGIIYIGIIKEFKHFAVAGSQYKIFLWLCIAVFLVGFAGLAAIVLLTDPGQGWMLISGFYGAVFVAATGLAAGLGAALRHLIFSEVWVAQNRLTIVRQSIFLGLITDLGLFFSANHLLNIYTMILLIVIFGVLELYFLNA